MLIFMLQYICWSFCCILCCSLFACCWCFLWLKLHFYVAVFHEREVFPSHREVVVLENDGEDRWENAIIILLFFFISNINICKLQWHIHILILGCLLLLLFAFCFYTVLWYLHGKLWNKELGRLQRKQKCWSYNLFFFWKFEENLWQHFCFQSLQQNNIEIER